MNTHPVFGEILSGFTKQRDTLTRMEKRQDDADELCMAFLHQRPRRSGMRDGPDGRNGRRLQADGTGARACQQEAGEDRKRKP